MARLYIGYIEQRYTWDKYIELSFCLDSVFTTDIRLLEYLYKYNAKNFNNNGDKSVKIGDINLEGLLVGDIFVPVNRLSSLGLIIIKNTATTYSEDIDPFWMINKISELGNYFYKYGYTP